jgi:small GTP-binding protein
VLVGEPSVGKTCLINQFRNNTYNSNKQKAIIASYEACSEYRDNLRVELQSWDAGGQEKFQSLSAVCRDAARALVVFDLTNHASFEGISNWISNFREVARQEAVVVVVGTKADLVDNQSASETEAKQCGEDRGLDFGRSPAKTGPACKRCSTF